MSSHKTNNSFLREKVLLRLSNLPKKSSVRVLDAFCGYGKIWDSVQKNSDKLFQIDGIDTNPKTKALHGNNLKILPSLDISVYDIIDLDSYGIPFAQFEAIKNRLNPGTVIFYTCIITGIGRIPVGLLECLGYSRSMIEKSRTLFCHSYHEKWLSYLSLQGIKSVSFISLQGRTRNYFYGCFAVPKTIS